MIQVRLGKLRKVLSSHTSYRSILVKLVELDTVSLIFHVRMHKTAYGMVEDCRIEVSLDGKTWTKVGEFKFGNIINDPSQRLKYFDKAVKARYFKFTSLKGARNHETAGAAEIGLLAK